MSDDPNNPNNPNKSCQGCYHSWYSLPTAQDLKKEVVEDRWYCLHPAAMVKFENTSYPRLVGLVRLDKMACGPKALWWEKDHLVVSNLHNDADEMPEGPAKRVYLRAIEAAAKMPPMKSSRKPYKVK